MLQDRVQSAVLVVAEVIAIAQERRSMAAGSNYRRYNPKTVVADMM